MAHGGLTDNQSKIFSTYSAEEMRTLCILQYSYADLDRTRLNEFVWQSCDEHKVTDIKEWTKAKEFSDPQDTFSILSQLEGGKIGTRNKKYIDERICASSNITLCINLTWKDGRQPPAVTVLKLSRTQKQEALIYETN